MQWLRCAESSEVAGIVRDHYEVARGGIAGDVPC
jgi:hypothetical protein